MKRILIELPRGVYERTSPITKEHRKHLSKAVKEWWAIPENKERMRSIQTGIHRRGWSEESKKKISESMKRYYRNKNRGEKCRLYNRNIILVGTHK
jgi:hypothetical protein